MSELIEGRNAVREALRAGARLSRVRISQGSKPDPALREIEEAARAADVEVVFVERGELDEASTHGSHQGVVAEIAEFEFASVRDLVADEDAESLIVALDGVTDPHNAGAIARTVEVAGGDGLLVAKRRSASFGQVAFKSSAGALAHLPVARETNLVRSLEALKDSGYWIVGAAHDAPDLVWDSELPRRMVLVVGAEGEGMARLTRETCDILVRLPVLGKIDSLNVGQATTAIAFEWLRQGSG